MGGDTVNSTQMGMYTNVHIIRHNMKKGGIIQQINVKNKITSYGLTSIAKLLNGDFTNITLEELNLYIPNYVAVGTIDKDASDSAIHENENYSTVSYIDRALRSEYLTEGTNAKQRLPIVQKNTLFAQNESFVTIELKSYIMEDQMVGYNIRELGVFADLEGSTCFARVVLPEGSMFVKEAGDVVDIVWKIIVASV